MELTLQPKPEVEVERANQGIVSRSKYFVKKNYEKINQYFFPAHFIRNWKPKAELLYPTVSDETAIQYECDFNRDVQSCFVEDNAEEVFLRTPPPCFVVVGKLGASVSRVGEQLAREFGSVFIQVEDIIGQLVQTETETGKTLHRLLRLGISLTLNFVLALLSYVAHTAEARHRGYVLCGLPCIPEELDLSAEQQFNYLFTWDNKPTVFINVLFDDEDLIKERTRTRYEIGNWGVETCIFLQENEGGESEDNGEDESDAELPAGKEETRSCERDIDVSPSRPCVQLPRDEEPQVWSQLELFDNKIRPAIRLLISRVDPQYLITVDSRLPNELEIVLARLSLLQVWKVPTAVPFIPPKRRLAASEKSGLEENVTEEPEEGEEVKSGDESAIDPEIKLAAEQPPETAFLTLFAKNTISPKYKWELSHYNYICPVSLREGEIVQGKSEFAVVFMKYIYFLRSEDAMAKFVQNPRAYVLPIRPDPLKRFIVLGYPYTGKTTLASHLAVQFSIPLIDMNTILKNDLERKKKIYQEFCQQKAECRESIRLNAQAWQEWRMEEEHRVYLIEEWVGYIQTLLSKRIDQFYSLGEAEGEASGKEALIQAYSPQESVENTGTMSEGSSEGEDRARDQTRGSLAVCGIAIDVSGAAQETRESPSPSFKIMKAMKHEDYNFNEPHLEVEANLFFSSLWNSFSNEDQRNNAGNKTRYEEMGGEWGGEMSLPRVVEEEGEREESFTVDWCSLLPPQSLSSFLMSRIPYTTREKRQSFKIFLEAASRAYWSPSKLKTEFAKWRLPCFMDIPLCEIFLDNPILLLKYVPEWLKERPLIPDPVDPMHPSVIEAGRVAFETAAVVSVKQNKEEVAVLIRDAVEKAEREGMRVTGEVISPGGWVLDNMTLDLDIWKKLACEGVFADHIYILLDSEPDYARIIKTWCELNRTSFGEWNVFEEEDDEEEEEVEEEEEEEKEQEDEEEVNSKGQEKFGTRFLGDEEEKPGEHSEKNLLDLLNEAVKASAYEDYYLDEIFEKLLEDFKERKNYIPPVSVDPFSHNIFENSIETWFELKGTINEEALIGIQSLSHYSTTNIFSKAGIVALQPPEIPLGHQLQKFTNAIINAFNKKQPQTEKNIPARQTLRESLQFFIFLLTLPGKLENLKDWLTSIDRGNSVLEFDVAKTSLNTLYVEIQKDLIKHFIKKPRELEAFEVEEIMRSERRDKRKNDLGRWDEETEFGEGGEDEEEEEEEEGEGEEEEDVRIFGESGPLCVVNLERDIFLMGKREFAVRYYGKLYYFWNENAKNKFIQNPEKYAPYFSVIRCYPPLRIFITGPLGSGKSTLATTIANQFSLSYIDFGEYLMRKLVPHLNITYEKFNSLGDPKLLLSENYNAAAKAVKEKFTSAPFNVRSFWMENPVYEEDFETKKAFKKKLIDLNQPVVSNDFPELTYMCVESKPEKAASVEDLAMAPSITENPYVSMKGLESMVRSYFENTAELTDYCIDKTAKEFWTKQPFLSHGLVLEGFPLRFSDVRYLIENNWLPDLVYELSLPEDAIVERNINDLMDAWNVQLEQEKIEEKTLEDTLQSIQRLNMYLRRNELLSKKQSALAKKVGEEEEEGENERKDSDLVLNEVEAILKEEFPPLSFNPEFETYEAGKVRIINNLLRSYRRDIVEIEKIRSVFQSMGIPWRKINTLKEVTENQISVFHVLDRLQKRGNFKGEFAFPMKMEIAEKLLEQGFYFLSKFGRWCPVQVYRMKNPIHMFRPLSTKGKITPIAYRNYIYFVGGESEKRKFIKDPVKYTFNEPHHPNIPLRVAIIGPPKSGKSTLSKRLGRTFDMKVVTMGTALRFVLEKMPKSTLAKSINNYLRRGCFLPLSFKVEALVACLNDPACVTQGFVFDGIPFTAALTQSLAERGKLPFVIISLVGEADFGKTNRQALDLKEFRLPYKNRVNLNSRYEDWNETYKRFAHWNQQTYNNLYEVNAKLSVVDIFYQAYDIISKSFFGILYYVEYCVSSRVLPLQYLCVGQHEYELRKSPFCNNCPVCWVEEKKLSNTPNPPPRTGLVQYLHHFYWICPNHTSKFTKNPKIYIPPIAPPPPSLLPEIISKSAFNALASHPKIHGYGRCPVTRVDFPSVLDWDGSWDHAAIYDQQVYLCKSSEMLDRFLARPWRYCKANTEFEAHRFGKSSAVEELGPPTVTSLPPIGFLEQTVADAIHECLQILGAVRPVFPNMSPTTTGCTFLGLHLKLHNQKKKTRYLEKEYYEFMLQHCKAYQFQVPPFKRPESEVGQGDFEKTWDDKGGSEESESSVDLLAQGSSTAGVVPVHEGQFPWTDLEAQADRKMWSAKVKQSEGNVKMMLTSDDELIEIPEVPKAQVVLKYQTYSLRPSPLPPVQNCLNFIYSVAPSLTVRGKFNYRTLYQPAPSFSSPYPTSLLFNPEKEFEQPLHKQSESESHSEPNIWKGKRTYSSDTVLPPKPVPVMDPDLKFMMESFIPRFQLFDKIDHLSPPPVPEAVDEEVIFFNPLRDYTYTLLLSDFFLTSNILRCFEWNKDYQYLEQSSILATNLETNLALTNAQIEYFWSPQRPPSVSSRKSFDSYRDIFFAASTFVSPPPVREPESSQEHSLERDKSSLLNFMHSIILEKLDELFTRLSAGSFSYDSFEVNIVRTESEMNEKHTSIVIREIFPYPPLPWDIVSRPYYSYVSFPHVFHLPVLDDIAHERHFSVLDGIIEAHDEIKFVRYPTWLQSRLNKKSEVEAPAETGRLQCKLTKTKPGTFYVYYDFFKLGWTSFLTYPFSWAYNLDMKGHFCGFHNDAESRICFEDLKSLEQQF